MILNFSANFLIFFESFLDETDDMLNPAFRNTGIWNSEIGPEPMYAKFNNYDILNFLFAKILFGETGNFISFLRLLEIIEPNMH